MRTCLYGSTALVAAGAMAAAPACAAEGVKLGLGGYYNTYFAVAGYDEADNDGRDFTPTGLFADGEVHFKGSTTLDNGITFGVRIELEAFQSGDQIDENYAFIEGSFGRFVIGGENTAAFIMHLSAPEVGAPLNTGWITSFVPPGPSSTTGFRTPSLSTFVDFSNDDHGIDYFSPRFSGFQIGASYVPAATVNGEGKNFPVFADENTEMHHLFSVGANFVESFSGIDVALAGGYRRAEASGAGGLEDPQQFSAGLNVSFIGFTLGGSFALEDSDRTTDGWSADLGLAYGIGPWAVSTTGFYSKVEGAAADPDDDTLLAISGAASYAVGPGIKSNFTVIYADWDDEGNGTDADGVAGILGMRIGF